MLDDPDYFTADNKKYSLIIYDRPESNNQPDRLHPSDIFIALDFYNKETNTIKGCFVIRMAKPVYRVVGSVTHQGKRSRVRHPTW